MRISVFLLFFSAAMLGVAPLRAAGDAEKGEKLAGQLCSRCHDVGRDSAALGEPLSFVGFAATLSAEEISEGSLTPRHTRSLSLARALTPENLDDIIAYIVSLKPGN